MKTLIIARHGNTFEAHETPRRIGVRTDMKLTQKGRERAEKIGLWIKSESLFPDAVFSSSLARSLETAELALAAAGASIRIQQNPMFDEIDHGPDENKTDAQIIARIGQKAFDDWNKRVVMPPGWSPRPETIAARWVNFGEEALTHTTTLVVTSNGIARFAPHMTGNFEGFMARFNLKLATGALGVLTHNDSEWQVEDWNIAP